MPLSTLLVIDDDNTLLYAVQKSLQSPTLKVNLANSASIGIRSFKENRPNVVLLDLRLSEASGLDVLREIRAIDEQVPVIMFTAYSTAATTIEASKSGAFDYLLKPVDLQKLKETVERAMSEGKLSARESSDLSAVTFVPGADVTIIGSSMLMQEIYKKIGRFASSTGNVLILGESGTGKELVAHAIHHHSPRRSNQFVAINCAALSETLLESELFGHEKGAFTGADKRRIGKFEFAHGGTLFLDEVADMSSATQAKVLRLLQEQSFERLGGNETIRTDVRIVAATNKNLHALMQRGLFREDLYYRLNVFCINLPALKEREGDIPDLVNYFVACFQKEFGKERVFISPEIYTILRDYQWPGNMRELQSVVKHALAHAVGSFIAKEHLPQALVNTSLSHQRREQGAPALLSIHDLLRSTLAKGEGDLYEKAIRLLDQQIIPAVLEHTGGNLQQACDILGISRNTLKSKIREGSISIEHFVLSRIDKDHQSLKAH